MSTVVVEQALAQPVSDRGRALLQAREDQWFERKSARVTARDLADAMIAFANAEGGIIVVGLWNGTVEGIGGAAPKSLSAWQQAALDFTTPAVPCRSRLVDCIDDAGVANRLVVFDVETSQQVHANRRDEVYLRVGDETRRLTFAQRQELLYDKGQSTYESTLVRDSEPADLDDALLASYAAAVNHPDPLRLLSARGLTDRAGRLTAAAVLLFAQEPQRWFPEAGVRVLRYRGTERGTGARQQLLHDRRIGGPIPQQLAVARAEILEHLPTRRALGRSGKFEKVGLVPEDAWLEAVVNAAVHRSYSISGDHIRVEIFDDRIEVESPGRFPGIADTSDPLHITRFARNPRIARVCADLSFGQELGEGVRRMFEEMRLAGLADPEYVQTAGSVRLTLSSTPVDRELESRLPPGSRGVVRMIREAGRISTGELAEATGRSRPVVIRQLAALRDAGVIRWVGNSPKDPRAYWTLHSE
ncbi:putative DNA binding domain-containing protein [Sporichthya brevicatena]|uniref:DNA binding domain-containing protein n=1 Tax=Sporichthya brevicatena TaxID=171442 RepID=A0ABN1G301_9ACTN